jgi:drug/metabolite transporter (DMT)-like permease
MKKFAMLLPFLTCVFMGIGTVFGTQAANAIDPLVLGMYSLTLCTALLTPFVFKYGLKKIVRMVKSNIRNIMLVTLMRPIVAGVVFTYGMKYTTAIKTLFLLRLEPLFVVLAGYFLFRDKITKKQIFFIALLMFGAFLLSTAGDISVFRSYYLGDMLLIISTIIFGASYYPAKKLSKKFDPIFATWVTSWVGLPFFIPLIALLSPVGSLMISMQGLLLMVAYTVFLYVFGIVLWYKTLESVKPWITSALLSLTPIVGSVFAYFWLGDTITTMQMVGAGIIFLSSVLISREID